MTVVSMEGNASPLDVPTIGPNNREINENTSLTFSEYQ